MCDTRQQVRQKNEMTHKDSELREKRQIASQFTAEKVARGMDGWLRGVQQHLLSEKFVFHI